MTDHRDYFAKQMYDFVESAHTGAVSADVREPRNQYTIHRTQCSRARGCHYGPVLRYSRPVASICRAPRPRRARTTPLKEKEILHSPLRTHSDKLSALSYDEIMESARSLQTKEFFVATM